MLWFGFNPGLFTNIRNIFYKWLFQMIVTIILYFISRPQDATIFEINMEKERAVPPDTMLCPARFARSLKRRGRCTSAAFPGVRSHHLAGHCVRAVSADYTAVL